MALWAIAFPSAEVLLQSWGSLALAPVRQILGTLGLLLVWISLDSWQVVVASPWRKGIWIGGIGFGFGATLFLVGQDLSNAVTPAIAAAMMPVVGAILEVIFDGRNLYDLKEMKDLGFYYESIGRKKIQ